MVPYIALSQGCRSDFLPPLTPPALKSFLGMPQTDPRMLDFLTSDPFLVKHNLLNALLQREHFGAINWERTDPLMTGQTHFSKDRSTWP